MFFLNFGLAQFVMVAGAASLATVALYLLDRSRRREVVSTLRFWTAARQPVQTQRRRKLQQPWSLVLQLLGVLLLLLAIAQPRIGNPFTKPAYHVLVLDTSAWMNARRGQATLMDTARLRARQWLDGIPPGDPVMLLRADALATPATPFEPDHLRVAAAITASQPSATALDIDAGLAFARHALTLEGQQGEIVFVGTSRAKRTADAGPIAGDGLRVVLVPDAAESAGLRRIGAQRSASDPSAWDILVAVHNYGDRPRVASVGVNVNDAPLGAKRMMLASGATEEASFTAYSRAAAVVDAQLAPGDAFPEDDRAVLTLPALAVWSVVVYTERPDVLRPFFASNPHINTQFRPPAQYQPGDGALVVLDRFHPSNRPLQDTIWIDPPRGDSPVPIVTTARNPESIRWIGNHPLGSGLRSSDTRVSGASVLQPETGDIRVAEIPQGPIVLARPGARKMVVIGFDPGAAGLRYRLSTPLAFANILRWIHPESFRQQDFHVAAAGSIAIPLEEATADDLQVSRADGSSVPFTLDHHTLRFFAGSRENVRVVSQNRESVYALTLPEVGSARWEPPANSLKGLPRGRAFRSGPAEMWPWLAALGAACLIADWLLFRGSSRKRLRAMPARSPLRKAS